MPTPTKTLKVEIPAPNQKTMKVRITGTAPIIFHRWTEKAKKMIRDKQMKKAQKGRDVRDPEAEFYDSFYKDKEGHIAFPALCIKQAMVVATRTIDGVPMTLVRGAVFVLGDKEGMIKILYKNKPIKLAGKAVVHEDGERKTDTIMGYDKNFPDVVEIREDMVRVGMGAADIRYRGQVTDWTMEFLIKFDADVFSAEQVLNLLNKAGFSSGLGEWRPEKNGDFGTFEVETK